MQFKMPENWLFFFAPNNVVSPSVRGGGWGPEGWKSEGKGVGNCSDRGSRMAKVGEEQDGMG